MCIAPARPTLASGSSLSLRLPRPPGSGLAGLAQVQSTARLGTQASLFFIGRGGWVKNLRPGAHQCASFTHGCPSMRALLQIQHDLRAHHARRVQNLAKHLSRIWAAFNAFRPQGQNVIRTAANTKTTTRNGSPTHKNVIQKRGIHDPPGITARYDP